MKINKDINLAARSILRSMQTSACVAVHGQIACGPFLLIKAFCKGFSSSNLCAGN